MKHSIGWLLLATLLWAVCVYAGYEPCFVWNRAKDWVPRPDTDHGTTNGNPAADRLGTPMWRYVYLTGDGLDSTNPWYRSGPGVPLVWDTSWYGQPGGWVYADNTSPYIARENMSQVLYDGGFARAPGVWWLNPCTGTVALTVRGTFTVIWSGSSWSATGPVDVVLAHYTAASGTMTALYAATFVKPTPGTQYDEARVHVWLPCVLVASGDAVLVTCRPQAPQSSAWIAFGDYLDFIWSPLYERGHVWNRQADWLSPTNVPGRSRIGNPGTDARGYPLWYYVSLSGGDAYSTNATPWWSNHWGHVLVADHEWYNRGFPAWVEDDNTVPYVAHSHLLHALGGARYDDAPGFWWCNPSNGLLALTVCGDLCVQWGSDDNTGVDLCDVDLAIAQYRAASDDMALVWQRTVRKPTPSYITERVHNNVFLPDLVVNSGDAVLVTMRARGMRSGNWTILHDNLRFVLDAPRITAMDAATDRMALSLANLWLAQTTLVERVSTPVSSVWEVAGTFIPAASTANWQHSLAPGLTQQFCRAVQNAGAHANVSGAAFGGCVSLDAFTDDNGYFRYTFNAVPQSLWLGGRSNLLCVRMPSKGILAVCDTPGWCWRTSLQEVIEWRCTNVDGWIIGAAPVTFALTSAVTQVVLYNDLTDTSDYPQGWLLGEVYEPNYALWAPMYLLWAPPVTSGVATVNVVGFERFVFPGPGVPEPGGLGALLGIGLFTIYDVRFTIWGRRRNK